jgi:hypothetical protein
MACKGVPVDALRELTETWFEGMSGSRAWRPGNGWGDIEEDVPPEHPRTG